MHTSDSLDSISDLNQHVDQLIKINENLTPPPLEKERTGGYINGQVMSYTTVKAIESETSYIQSQWPLFALKEILDNA